MLFKRKNPEPVSAPAEAAAEAPSDLSSPIADMVRQFEYLERMCDDAIQRQDDLVRSNYRRVEDATTVRDEVIGGVKPGIVATAKGELVPRHELSLADLDFADFRELSELAAKSVPKGMPFATKRFILNACSLETAEIEHLENEIRIIRAQMQESERRIINTVPGNIMEAVVKLKFMAALMIDGVEMEQDYFAYLVEECAEVVEDKLRALRLRVTI